MEFFKDLASLVEERWKEKDYNEEFFPEIAAEALIESNPANRVDAWEIVRWVNSTHSLPVQHDVAGLFGNPPITLFSGPRFYIDVYYWVDGTTSIHQHGFSGAFQVLLGSSIHSHYTFKRRQEINQHFAIGETNLEGVELLELGAVKQIRAGDEYIHSLFHLDRPSATVCIRTFQTYKGVPQYNYDKPYFATDPFFKETFTVKRTQFASLLFTIKHPEADAMIGELLSHSDFQTTFAILDVARNHLLGNQLEAAFGLSSGQQRFDALVELARRRHGHLVDFIQPVFDEVERQRNLIIRRAQITSNEHRFFLALLLNVPDRRKILDLVSQRFRDRDPVDTVTDWVEELARTKFAGSSEPNVLGIEDFDEDYLFAFQLLLRGETMDQIRKEFQEELSGDDADAMGDKPEQLCDAIRNSMLFRSIFLEPQPSLMAVQRALP
jgi:hypothetical protein